MTNTPTTKNTTRITAIEKRLAELREEYDVAKAKREDDRELLTRGKEIKEQIQTLEHDAQVAKKNADWTAVAEIEHGKIPALQTELSELVTKLEQAKQDGTLWLNDRVEAEDIAGIISRWTGIPATKLVQTEAQKLVHLEDHLHKRVIGQDHAVKIVANAVRRSKAWLQDQDRPLASFLFLWPTGVGKTELAKTLAEFLFDDERAMIRLDMSEYAERHTVAKLIGSPPGYIWHDEGGQLTEAVRRTPYSVILFDEVEKAHPDVFNTLLQMLDDGRLTDSKGRTVNFKNTVIIMTSNIGSEKMLGLSSHLTPALSSKERELKRKEFTNSLLPDLQMFFRPEFLNRLDDLIVFDPISESTLTYILDIQLSKLATHLKQDKDIELLVTDAAKAYLVREGYDPQFGARPLKRVIQNELLDRLALAMLDGSVGVGETVKVDLVEWKIEVAAR